LESEGIDRESVAILLRKVGRRFGGTKGASARAILTLWAEGDWEPCPQVTAGTHVNSGTDKFITRSEAFERVGKALRSELSEHIRPPTKTENDLLEEFGHGPLYQPGTRFLGGAGYNPFAEIEQGEDHAAVQDAQRRHRDWQWHREQADDWLTARGFIGKRFDRAAFEKAFDACFAADATGTDSQSAPARPFDLSVKAGPKGESSTKAEAHLAESTHISCRKRGQKPTLRERIIAQMQAQLDDETLTESQLDGFIEKELASRYGASRDTCRNARNEVLSKYYARKVEAPNEAVSEI